MNPNEKLPDPKTMTTLADPLDIFDEDVQIEGPSDDQFDENARQTSSEFELDLEEEIESDDVEVEAESEEVEVQLPDDDRKTDIEDTKTKDVAPAQKAEPTPEEIAAAEKEAERKSRASERIRELANEKNQALAEAEAAKKAAFEAQVRTVAMTKTMVQTHIDATTKELQDAVDVGDSAKVAESMQKLNKQQADLARLDQYLEQNKEYATTKTDSNTKTAQPNLTEAQQAWLENKTSWVDTANYGKLPLEERKAILPMRNWARELGNRLVEEGFDPTDSLFFEELDLRMEEKFGDDYKALAEGGPSMVLSLKNKKSSSGETLNTSKEQKSALGNSNGVDGKKSPQQKAKALPIASPSANAGAATGQAQQAKRTMKFSDLPPESQRAYELGASNSMTKEQYVKRYMQEIARSE